MKALLHLIREAMRQYRRRATLRQRRAALKNDPSIPF